MILVAFILMTIVSVILGVFYALTKWDTKWHNILIKCLALLSCLALCLTCANLSSKYGAYTLMVSLGIAALISFEVFKCSLSGKPAIYILPATNLVAIVLFLFAGVSLTNFSLWALLSGLFFGAGLSFIVKIVKKSWPWQQILMTGLNLAVTFAFLMQSIAIVMTAKMLATALLFLFSALCLIVHTIIEIFGKGGKTITIISNALRILSFILLSMSIYFI